jgi:phosphoserine phosphatase RsbU/P
MNDLHPVHHHAELSLAEAQQTDRLAGTEASTKELPQAFLRALIGPEPGRHCPLNGEQFVIGRHPSCDMVVADEMVDDRHAQITRFEAVRLIEDLGSRQGTIVNGQILYGPRLLSNNDQIMIGELLFSFHDCDPGCVDAQGDCGTWLLQRVEGSTGSVTRTGFDVQRKALAEFFPTYSRLVAFYVNNRDTAVTLEQTLPIILDSVFKIFLQADRGFVVLQGPEPGILVPKAMKLRCGESEDPIRISRTIVRKTMDHKEAILAADAASDARIDSRQSIADFRVRSMMCAPLLSTDGVAMGVIQIDTLDQRAPFTQGDLVLFLSVANQAALVVEKMQNRETLGVCSQSTASI